MRFSTEYHTCSYSLGQFGEPWNCSCYLSSEIPQKKRWLSLRKYSNDAFIIFCSYFKNNAISTGGIIIKATKKGWKSGWQIINGATQNILSHPQTSYQDWDILEALDIKGKMTHFWWAFLLQCHLFQLSGFVLFFFFFSYNKSYAMLYISDDAFLAFAATIQSVMNGSSRLIFGFLFDKYGFKVRVSSQSSNIFTKFIFFCRTHYSFRPCPVPPSPFSLWTSPSLTATRLGQRCSFSWSHLPFMAFCQVGTFS